MSITRVGAALLVVGLTVAGCSSDGRARSDADRQLKERLSESEPRLRSSWESKDARTLLRIVSTVLNDADGYAVEQLDDRRIELRFALRASGRDGQSMSENVIPSGACFRVVGRARSVPTIDQIDCPPSVADEPGAPIEYEPELIGKPRDLR